MMKCMVVCWLNKQQVIKYTLAVWLVIFLYSCKKSDVNSRTNLTTYISIQVNSVSRTWTTPEVSMYAGASEAFGISWILAGAINFHYPNVYSGPVIRLERTAGTILPGPLNYTSYPLGIYDSLAPVSMIGDYRVLSAVRPVITEFDSVGLYMAGNFSGTFIRERLNSLDTVNLTCEFRMLRTK